MVTIARKSEASLRRRDFVLAQCLLVLAAATVGMVDGPKDTGLVILFVLVAGLGALAYVRSMDPFAFYDQLTQAVLIVVGTAAVFGILLVSEIGAAVTVPFFVVIIMVAGLENVFVLAPIAAVLGPIGVSMASDPFTGPAAGVARAVLFMAAAVFYWFAVLPEREASTLDEGRRWRGGGMTPESGRVEFAA